MSDLQVICEIGHLLLLEVDGQYILRDERPGALVRNRLIDAGKALALWEYASDMDALEKGAKGMESEQ